MTPVASDRLIYIAGTPSGGTSAVAGALHHLGVDMGNYTLREHVRGYAMFEDTGMSDFKITPEGDRPIILRQRFRLREYIAFRQEHQRPGQRIGFKGSALYWLGEPDLDNLEADIVLVHRPLEHSILSDQRIWSIVPKRRDDIAPLTTDEVIEHAAGIAGAWSAKNQLRYAIAPAAEVKYYDLLTDPRMQLITLCHKLHLNPTDEQFTTAVQFIDPKMRNV